MSNKELNNLKDKPKRVLMIAQSFYDYDARILRQVEILKNNGYEVEIICLNYQNRPKKEKVNDIIVHRILDKFDQNKIHNYILYSIFFLIKSLILSIKLHKKNKFDVVQVHNMPDYLVFAALYLKLKGIYILLDIHDLTLELFQEKWGKSKFLLFKPILLFAEKISIYFADEIITVSEQCKNTLGIRNKGKQIHVIMNTPDLKYFPFNHKNNNSTDKSIKLIYHGTIAERYGIHNLVYTLFELVKIKQESYLTIIGNIKSEYGKYIYNLAQELDLKSNISFEESIPYSIIAERLNKADFGLVLPEISDYTQFGIPTKVFEYAAIGLPQIVSDLKSIRYVFQEESIVLVNPHKYENIARLILDISNNPKKRENMINNAFKDLQKVSYDVMSKRYYDIYQNIFEKSL